MKTLSNEIKLHILSDEDNAAVYVGTYRKYNEGSIFGAWLDLTTFADYDEFMSVCRALHSDEKDPEFMYQDFQNFPEAWYHESTMDEELFDKIREYSELSDDEKEAFEDYINEIDSDGDIDTMRDRYMGQYDSGADFAEEITNECYFEELKHMGWLSNYIDFEKVWDCSLSYDYTETKYGYFFQSC